ncbi:phage tail assembly chaperone [Methylovorus glucosotrophus]|uniref:phage tail assembly chaperone n=1 Tax=Methylovorus glucosotrophus TaxID=266009 RepID=UPI003F8BB17C
MVAFCAFDFSLNQKLADGFTRREHYIAAQLPIEDWGYPEFSDSLFTLWQHFLRLNKCRPVGLGNSPIPQSEIQAYQANRRIRLSNFELDAIDKLDLAALAEMNRKTK